MSMKIYFLCLNFVFWHYYCAVYDECKKNRIRFVLKILFVCLYTISLSLLCKLIWRHWTHKMPVRYIWTGDRAPADATSGYPVVDWTVETRIWGAGWWSWWWPMGWHTPLPINSHCVDKWATLAGPAMHLSHILQRTALGQGCMHLCSNVVRCGVWDGCIVGFSRLVYWPITPHFVTCSHW